MEQKFEDKAIMTRSVAEAAFFVVTLDDMILSRAAGEEGEEKENK